MPPASLWPASSQQHFSLQINMHGPCRPCLPLCWRPSSLVTTSPRYLCSLAWRMQPARLVIVPGTGLLSAVRTAAGRIPGAVPLPASHTPRMVCTTHRPCLLLQRAAALYTCGIAPGHAPQTERAAPRVRSPAAPAGRRAARDNPHAAQARAYGAEFNPRPASLKTADCRLHRPSGEAAGLRPQREAAARGAQPPARADRLPRRAHSLPAQHRRAARRVVQHAALQQQHSRQHVAALQLHEAPCLRGRARV